MKFNRANIVKVTWMQNLHQFWVETDGVLRQNKSALPRLYRLSDRSHLPRNPDVMASFNERDPLYDDVAQRLIK